MAVDKLVDSTQLDADLTSVANAIRTKGGTSAQLAFPVDFVSAVNAIPTGGGGDTNPVADNDDVIFIDYDGTIRYSYSAADFANLSALPDNPTHTDIGLVAEGWNWTLAGAKSYVAKYKQLVIGQSYYTASGATELDVELQEGRLSPSVGLRVNGTVSVDWGDGSTPSTLTGKNSNQFATHTYSAPGSYTVKITKQSGTYYIVGDSSKGSVLFCHSSGAAAALNAPYQTALKAVRLSSDARIYSNYNFKFIGIEYITIPKSAGTAIVSGQMSQAFLGCSALGTVVYPYGLTVGYNASSDQATIFYISLPETIAHKSFGYCFRSNSRLRRLSIPATATDLGSFAVAGCQALSTLWIPEGVTTMQNVNLGGLGELHLAPTTPPTVSGLSLPSDVVIYVPYSADHSILEAYQGATNWSTYASNMVEE